MPPEIIRIKNPHHSHLLQQAHALRHAGSLCDVTFSVEGQIFGAHRLVLACASSALAPRLLREAPDWQPLRYTLDLCSSRTFQQVLDFSYGQALALPPGDLGALRQAAGLLGMRPLEERCQKLLESLDHRPTEMRQAQEEIEESRAEADQRLDGSPVPDEMARRNFSPEEEEEETAPPPHSDTPQGQTSFPPSKKRVITPYTRDSVIRASSSHPPWASTNNCPPWASVNNCPPWASANNCPPWASVNNCPLWASVNNCPPWASINNWHHVTLRLMAQNYSNIVAVHSLQHPLPLAPHTVHPSPKNPVLGSVDLAHVQSQRLYASSPDLEEIVRQDLKAKKSPSPKAMAAATTSSEQRYLKRIPNTQHFVVSPLHESRLSETCSPSSGEAYHCYVTSGGGGGLKPPQQPPAKPYQCQQCPKRFSLKHQLETHRRVHTGEKPFECRLCGQRSRDYSAMIKHLRIHGGARPYQCTVCRDFCSSLVAMQKHVQKHSDHDFPPDWTIRHTYLYTSHV